MIDSSRFNIFWWIWNVFECFLTKHRFLQCDNDVRSISQKTFVIKYLNSFCLIEWISAGHGHEQTSVATLVAEIHLENVETSVLDCVALENQDGMLTLPRALKYIQSKSILITSRNLVRYTVYILRFYSFSHYSGGYILAIWRKKFLNRCTSLLLKLS